MTRSKEVLQKSQNWDKYEKRIGLITEGYPFDEGFPANYIGKTYELICRKGIRSIASVDDVQQYESGGFRWKSIEGEPISGRIVAGWRELPSQAEKIRENLKPANLRHQLIRPSASCSSSANIDLSIMPEGPRLNTGPVDTDSLLKIITQTEKGVYKFASPKDRKSGHKQHRNKH